MNSIVVAFDNERTIGRNNQLPWAGQLPADMRHFRELTEGSSIIMGRKTWESLPENVRPLPRRENIVLSLSQIAFNGALVADSLADAFNKASSDIMVIGGAEVYEQALPLVNRIYATKIHTSTTGGDAFFPTLLNDEWRQSEAQHHLADEKNAYDYSFITYLRRDPIFKIRL